MFDLRFGVLHHHRKDLVLRGVKQGVQRDDLVGTLHIGDRFREVVEFRKHLAARHIVSVDHQTFGGCRGSVQFVFGVKEQGAVFILVLIEIVGEVVVVVVAVHHFAIHTAGGVFQPTANIAVQVVQRL